MDDLAAICGHGLYCEDGRLNVNFWGMPAPVLDHWLSRRVGAGLHFDGELRLAPKPWQLPLAAITGHGLKAENGMLCIDMPQGGNSAAAFAGALAAIRERLASLAASWQNCGERLAAELALEKERNERLDSKVFFLELELARLRAALNNDEGE